MLIKVQYHNNRFDFVKDNLLHSLIETQTISRFLRSSGWVEVGRDTVRAKRRNSDVKTYDPVKNIVRVEYTDNRYDYVDGETLNTLIEQDKVAKFRRMTGWVTIGTDALRSPNRKYTYRYPSELKRLG